MVIEAAAKRKNSALQPVEPVTGTALEVRNGEDEHVLGLVDVEHGIRKGTLEVTPHRLAHEAVALWRAADFCDHRRNRGREAVAEREAFRIVNRPRVQRLGARFRVEDEGLHRPARWRNSARTCSPGMGCTLPLRISARRRSASSAQAFSISGSISSWSSRVSRSTSSASWSRGNSRDSATI